MQPSSRQKIPLPSLLLKKSAAAALAAKATAATAAATTAQAAPLITAAAAAINPTTTTAAANGTNSRRCIFGCDDNAIVLCRFPVHDRQRCDNWLKFFRVSEEFIASHGLSSLRVCLRHFHQQNQMAKTRMKTTPTRLQKHALSAEDLKFVSSQQRRLRQMPTATPPKESLHVTSTVVVPAPKRTNSISSATSSISAASDAHSTHSDSEFVGALSPLTATATTKASTTTAMAEEETTKSAEDTRTTTSSVVHSAKALGSTKAAGETATTTTKTLNGLLGKHSDSNGNNNIRAPLKNRKVFMITERCDAGKLETAARKGHAHPPIGQKRKMYLIMEETPSQQQQHNHSQQPQQPTHTASSTSATTNGVHTNGDATNGFRSESGGNATKKLTLVTDHCDAQLTQKFEQILPEILSRINSKAWDRATTTAPTISAAAGVDAAKPNGLATRVKSVSPAPVGGQGVAASRAPITLPPKKNRMKIINTSGHGGGGAATPVIVSTPKGSSDNGVTALPSSHKNINLSADFLFLMKMLPKLEAIPEPHKSHVKNCIEKIVTQNAALFDEQ